MSKRIENRALIEAINASGLKRGYIAEKLGVSRPYLRKLEHGGDFPTAIGLRLEQILGVPLMQLIPPSSRGGFSSAHAS